MRRVKGEGSLRTRELGAAMISMIITALLSGSCFFDTRTNLCEASGRRCAPGQVCAVDQDVCIPIGGCGDGVVNRDRGEVCDDGNIRNGDGCSSDCSTDKLCGNGVVDPGEQCDAGPIDTPGCDHDCTFVVCGDGYPNLVAGEDCDLGDTNINTDTCNGRFCKASVCGDSFYNSEAGEKCDTSPIAAVGRLRGC
jgi:cysteine-rich repeat protein